ncbi:hypothetical protein DRJ25_00615 [Candidatus Woesearchaeota archaeon]|nr:MAG: hypothetical protein DRJ25_00615 [Candidatus Woesearchaeota archaeon]
MAEFRWFVLILMFLFLMPAVFALRVVNTGIAADQFSTYGDVIAYESDGGIYVYDIKTKQSRFVADGSNPSVFGFIVAFDSKESVLNKDVNFDNDFDDPVIRYFDLRDDKLYSTDFIGENPSVYGNKLVFDVFEGDVNIDLDKDEDVEDHVVQVFDIETGTIDNTGFVGENVFTGLGVVAFETDEKEYGNDLNGDSKISDKVIRLLFLDDLSLVNTARIGEYPRIFKDSVLVFVVNEALARKDVNKDGDFDDDFPVVLALPDLDEVNVGLAGAFPSVFKDVLVFVDDNKLVGFSLSNKTWYVNDVFCSRPVLFENHAVVLTHEKLVGEDLDDDGDTKDNVLRLVFFEDPDKDDVLDVVDNCPDVPNAQRDWDFDGVGDACDPDKPPVEEVNLTEENVSGSDAVNLTGPLAESGENDSLDVNADETGSDHTSVDDDIKIDLQGHSGSRSHFGLFLFIFILIVVVFLAVKFLPKYFEKRRKGFGF